MNWPAVVLSVVLVAPAVAQSQQPSGNRTLTLRACVQQGTHGSLGNLSQAEVVAPGVPAGPHRMIYWFNKNLDGFKDHAGHLVEITGTIAEVLEGTPELKATDGVFAEIQAPEAAVATSGQAADKAAAAAGGSGAAEVEEPPTTVVKAAVVSLKNVGACR